MANVRRRKMGVGGAASKETKDEEVKVNALWGLFFKLFAFVLIIIPSLCLLAFVFLLESPVDPDPVTDILPEPPRLEGPLAYNDRLVFKGERLFEAKVIGPESIVHQSGHLYTGTADGKIIDIDLKTQTINIIATLGPPPCGEIIDEELCGRPLGLRFDNNGYLIVLDAYLGLYKINITSFQVIQMFPGSMEVEGQVFRFLNDLDIAMDGTIYFTDSSRFRRRDFILDMLEGKPGGRLLAYNPAMNSTGVVYKNLYFANGVQLSKDESYLLISETFKARISKYHITGPKQGQLETFADNLPGLPDNIRRSSSGGYWVALGTCRNAGQLNILDTLQHYPWLRKQIAKIPIRFLSSLTSGCTLIIEMDERGKIVRNLSDPKGQRLSHISEVEEDGVLLYTGSYFTHYIGRVNTDKQEIRD